VRKDVQEVVYFLGMLFFFFKFADQLGSLMKSKFVFTGQLGSMMKSKRKLFLLYFSFLLSKFILYSGLCCLFTGLS